MANDQTLRDKVKQKRLADLLKKHQEGKTSASEVKELDALLAEREKQSDATAWLCSNAQLASLLEVSQKTICEWAKNGMPKVSTGTYDFAKVFPWWKKEIYEGKEDQDETITEAKRKYWVERARRETMRNDIQLENLLPCEKVYPEWTARAAGLRQTLIAIPSRMAPTLANQSEDTIRTKLREEIFIMLENFCRDSAYCPQKKPIRKKSPAVKVKSVKRKKK